MRKTRFYDVELLQRFKWGTIEGKNIFVKTSEDTAIGQNGRLYTFAEKARVYPYDTPIPLRKGYIKHMRETYSKVFDKDAK